MSINAPMHSNFNSIFLQEINNFRLFTHTPSSINILLYIPVYSQHTDISYTYIHLRIDNSPKIITNNFLSNSNSPHYIIWQHSII